VGIMTRAEKAIDNTRRSINGAVILGAAALVLAAVALIVAIRS
jgi:hypothetical protein